MSAAPASPCPNCGVLLEAHVLPMMGIDADPRPGDATVCGSCDSILIFDGDLQLRFPNEEENRLIFRSFDDEKRVG